MSLPTPLILESHVVIRSISWAERITAAQYYPDKEPVVTVKRSKETFFTNTDLDGSTADLHRACLMVQGEARKL